MAKPPWRPNLGICSVLLLPCVEASVFLERNRHRALKVLFSSSGIALWMGARWDGKKLQVQKALYL